MRGSEVVVALSGHTGHLKMVVKKEGILSHGHWGGRESRGLTMVSGKNEMNGFVRVLPLFKSHKPPDTSNPFRGLVLTVLCFSQGP